MVIYNCALCNFTTKLKSNFARHHNTIKHKKNKNLNENYVEEGLKKIKKGHKKDLKGLNMCPFEKKSGEKRTQKGHKRTQKSEKINEKNKKFECDLCGVELKTRAILLRHKRKYCKVKKENDNNLLLQIEKYEKEKQEHNKEKDKLYDYIEKLIEKTGDTNINIENQTNNQIILNNFGNEDISHISDKFMQKLLVIPYASVQKLIEKVHFSNKKTENKNIALTNKKEKMIKIFKNNKWKYKNRDEIMDEIINTNYTRIDDYYIEKGKEKLNNRHNDKYLEFQDKFEDQVEDLHKKIRAECEMILLSDNL